MSTRMHAIRASGRYEKKGSRATTMTTQMSALMNWEAEPLVPLMMLSLVRASTAVQGSPPITPTSALPIPVDSVSFSASKGTLAPAMLSAILAVIRVSSTQMKPTESEPASMSEKLPCFSHLGIFARLEESVPYLCLRVGRSIVLVWLAVGGLYER